MDLGWYLDEDWNTGLLRVEMVLGGRGRSLADQNPKQCLRSCRGSQEDGWSLRQKTDLRMAVEVEDAKTRRDRK